MFGTHTRLVTAKVVFVLSTVRAAVEKSNSMS